MNKLLPFGLAAFLVVGGATLGYSQEDPNAGQHSGKKIEAMLRDNGERIDAGVRNGELTRAEIDHLHARQDAVRAELNDYRTQNHGYLTNGQEANLEATLTEISNQIHHDKHPDSTQ